MGPASAGGSLTSQGDKRSASTPAVELVDITKAYPGVLANDRVHLSLSAGEVHCLLGENGAGKSTLMSILSGMIAPDSGHILLDGEEVHIDSPRRALDLGIGMVYQHTTLVPTLTVLENLMLGAEGEVRLHEVVARARLEEIASTLGADVDPDAMAGALALGKQQQIEIIKALWRGSKVVILDEPTSMLTPQGVEELAKVIRGLTESGLAVVLITHKLHEATSMGDRVSVLREGRVVGDIQPDELRSSTAEELEDRIVSLMFGDEPGDAAVVDIALGETTAPAPRVVSGEPLLELVGLSAEGGPGEMGLHDVQITVHVGEVLGVAGVDGNGQRELAECIAGHRRPSSGDIKLAGASIRKARVAQRERLGLRYVTDDRLGEGTVGPLSVSMNLVLKRIGQPPFWRSGRLRQAAIDRHAAELIESFDIRTPSPETRISTLSGGNIQRALLARELSGDPAVVVYNKPTYGLDLKTTKAVRQRILDQADRGVAAVLISTEMDELITLSDRIAVLFRGRIVGIVESRPGVEREVGQLMVGGSSRTGADVAGREAGTNGTAPTTRSP